MSFKSFYVKCTNTLFSTLSCIKCLKNRFIFQATAAWARVAPAHPSQALTCPTGHPSTQSPNPTTPVSTPWTWTTWDGSGISITISRGDRSRFPSGPLVSQSSKMSFRGRSPPFQSTAVGSFRIGSR